MSRLLPFVICCCCYWSTADSFAQPVSETANVEQFSNDTGNEVDNGWVRNARTGEDVPLVFSVVGEMAVLEGDIVLGTAANVSGRYEGLDFGQYAQSVAVTNIGTLWSDGIVPYQINSAIAGGSLPQKIASAIDHIESNTSVSLVLRTAQNQNLYPNYVEFVSSTGCASYIGKIGGRQKIWLAEACSTGNVIHELGHVLGLYHEQSRADRDSYVAINWQNIVAGTEHNFQQQLFNVADIGDYDYGSIMHYGKYFFSSNGGATIVPINPANASIGQRISLSDGDTQALNKLYGTDLSLTLQATPSLVEPAATITLSAYVTNLYGPAATDLSLSVPIPLGSAFLGAAGDQWTCLSATGSVACERDVLQGNATTSVEIYLLAPAYGFPLTLTAQIVSSAFDNADDNNSDSVDVIVNSENFVPTINPNQSFNVYHLSPNGTDIGQVLANDYNNDTLSDFEIVGGTIMQAFSIDPQTGRLSVANNQLWDVQQSPQLTLDITASDGTAVSEIGTITIHLLENRPGIGESTGGGGGGGSVSGAGLFVLLVLNGLFKLARADGRGRVIWVRLGFVVSMRKKRENHWCSGIT